jgi:hypothetical protein
LVNFSSQSIKINEFIPESIDVKLFCDIISTIGVFKSQIKFIFFIEHFEAFFCFISRTSFITTTMRKEEKLEMSFKVKRYDA